MAAMLLFDNCTKNYINKGCKFLEYLLPHIIQGPYIQWC